MSTPNEEVNLKFRCDIRAQYLKTTTLRVSPTMDIADLGVRLLGEAGIPQKEKMKYTVGFMAGHPPLPIPIPEGDTTVRPLIVFKDYAIKAVISDAVYETREHESKNHGRESRQAKLKARDFITMSTKNYESTVRKQAEEEKARKKKAEEAKQKRQQRAPKHEPKFIGVGRSLNGTTTTEGSDTEEPAEEKYEDVVSTVTKFNERDGFLNLVRCLYGGDVVDEVAQAEGDDSKLDDTIFDKFAGEDVDSEEEPNNVRSILAKRNSNIQPHLRDDAIDALLKNKGSGGRAMRLWKTEALEHLISANQCNAMIASALSNSVSFDGITVGDFMKKHGSVGGGRRLGSDEDDEYLPDVVQVTFSGAHDNEVLQWEFVVLEKSTCSVLVEQFHRLGDIPPESTFAQTFANVKECKIENGKDLLDPYFLAYKYPSFFWNIVLSTTEDDDKRKEICFGDRLRELVPGTDFEFADSRKRKRELSEVAKSNLAQKQIAEEVKAKKQMKKEAKKNG